MIGKPGFYEGPRDPKIETIKMPNGDEVSYSPARGGIITSIKFQGTEILYLDKETFNDSNANVRGGIPVLFPNAGPINSPKFPKLTQHGFARNLKWKEKKVRHALMLALESNKNTRAVFPGYEFILGIDGQFEEDGRFSITQSVENMGKDAMPISMGLHPYFRVPENIKEDIKFNFKGGKEIEKNIDKWANGKAFSIANPKAEDPSAVMKVSIPSLGMLSIDASANYQRIWIWSLPGKDFICIEPVMRDSGGLVNNPAMVEPGAVLRSKVYLKLAESV